MSDLQYRLLRWYRKHRRKLPWRGRRSAYRIWISEIMLQQTQVRTMLPYYRRFTRRFPDVFALADAQEVEVLAFWAGLGYYSRARNLHRAAKIIAQRYGGMIPDDAESLLALPGIGRYTAGAILSIAYNQPVPAVDGNVRRIVSRLRGISAYPGEQFFWRQAESWIPETRPSEFNQALMELGALVCLPAKPLCGRCPVGRLCKARAAGLAERIPRKQPGRSPESVRLVILALERHGSLLLSMRRSADFIPGEWSLPTMLLDDAARAGAAAAEYARRLLGGGVRLVAGPRIRHAITCRRIEAYVFRGVCDNLKSANTPPAGFSWIAPREAVRRITSSLYAKALRATARDAPRRVAAYSPTT